VFRREPFGRGISLCPGVRADPRNIPKRGQSAGHGQEGRATHAGENDVARGVICLSGLAQQEGHKTAPEGASRKKKCRIAKK